ncbi:hypothetical protein ATN00_17910 [Sphingobium baderi]|uniref:RepB-like DNA primase domain-containing protein n=1 Tax=Sphingobium baderi TaxID=1332080 RepID=A0A0S3F2E8_9SPHN|nr:hypothetical protein ATN00_17910 [Sphingobium baderi]
MSSIPAITLSEFQNGKIIGYHLAPLYGDNPGDFDALQLIEQLAATSSTFGTSEWRTANALTRHHDGCSAVTLEYDATKALKVATRLTDAERAFLMIPTQSDGLSCYAFLFPTLDFAKYADAKRCAQLIAQYVEVDGLTPNSHLPSFQFRIRHDLPTHFHDGALLNAQSTVELGQMLLTKIRSFER